ncbi:MAG: transglutaminase family protein [Bacteroidia bacterium]|nr:transglutaminase family protein [Bacteroidia bacterium]
MAHLSRPDPRDLPHLTALLDDPDADVRAEVHAALLRFGPALESELARQLSSAPAHQLELAQGFCETLRAGRMQQQWPACVLQDDEHLALEASLDLLADVDAPWGRSPLPVLLDQMAQDFHDSGLSPSVRDLHTFLYLLEGFSAPVSDYYHPRNSNLIEVIARREGLQISLASIAMLLGNRIGVTLYGFNLPGHFMYMQVLPEGPELYDPFRNGEPLSSATQAYLFRSLDLRNPEDYMRLRASVPEIILRVLRNLVSACKRAQLPGLEARFQACFDELMEAIRKR